MTRAEKEFDLEHGPYGWTPREKKEWIAAYKKRGELDDAAEAELFRREEPIPGTNASLEIAVREAIRKMDE